MRLPKSSLVAAACLLTAASTFAYQDVQSITGTETVTAIDGGGTLSWSTIPPGTSTGRLNNILYNPSSSVAWRVQITAGETLTVFSEYATSVDLVFSELGNTDTTAMVTNQHGVVYKTDPLTGLPTGGNFIKAGGGTLQINSWTAAPDGSARYSGIGPATWTSNDPLPYIAPAVATPLDLSPSITGDPDGRNATRGNGIQGTFTINQGTVRLAGFINTWHEFGAGDITPIPFPPVPAPVTVETADGAAAADPRDVAVLARRMTGVREVILNGSSVLEFTNSPVNQPTAGISSLTNGLRINFLHNVHAGVNDDQLQTEIIAGTTSDYRIILHNDQGVDGSVGILGGAGSFIKTGAGSLTILNEARMTGDFTAAGGRTVLDTAGGRALATAASVNLAGTVDSVEQYAFDGSNSATLISSDSTASRRGSYVRYLTDNYDSDGDGIPDTFTYKPGYTPEVGTHTVIVDDTGAVTGDSYAGAELEIKQDQTIHNFQSNFALTAAPSVTRTIDGVKQGYASSAVQAAADSAGKGEPVIAGTGIGARLILGGNVLTILQTTGRDGFFEGSIEGGDADGTRFTPTPTLVSSTAGSSTYQIAFDRIPGFGTYRLGLTNAAGSILGTDSIRVDSATDLRDCVAEALGLNASAVTVTADSSGQLAPLVYTVTIDTPGLQGMTAFGVAMGKIVFTGDSADSKLVLNLSNNSLAETEIASGSLVANSEGLGSSRINVSTGELRIYQNKTGELNASLLGGGTVRVVASALLDNGSGTSIQINSEQTIGELNFAIQQRRFTGDLVVNDGVDVSLSAVTGLINDTLLNARSITLQGKGGVGDPGSVLSFNDTDQLVRNLSGDANSKVALGRGTMTLNVDSTRTYLGGIEGAGAVIKTGSATYNLVGGGRDDYFGATVVREGAITLGTADTIRKSSGLVLSAGTTVTAGGRNQTVGALFGEQGSTVAMGAAILTVGFTPGRYTELGGIVTTAIDTNNWRSLPLCHNYLGTTENLRDYALPGVGGATGATLFDRTPLHIDQATEDNFTINTDPATGWPILGMVDQTRLYLARVGYLFDRNGDGVISQAETDQAAASAATLAFAGTITGAGAAQNVRYGTVNINPLVTLSKTGIETLFLTGANTFTGAAVVRQGVLSVEGGALAAGVNVYVLANSATIDLDGDGIADVTNLDDGLGNTVQGYDLNGDGVFDAADHIFDGTLAVNVASGTSTWTGAVIGDGNFMKTGAGTLVLDPAAARYTGATTVAAGTLDLTLVETAAGSGLATLGDVTVEAGATLLLRTPVGFTANSSITYAATTGISGGFDNLGNLSGNFTKAGAGTLVINGVNDGFGNLTSRLQVGGTIRVQEGVLAVDTLPSFGVFQTLSIDSGAEFRITLAAAADEWLTAAITGAGTLTRLGGGTLLIQQDPDPAPLVSSAGFTGTLKLGGGITELGLPGALPNAHIHLVASGDALNPTSLWLDEGAYAFAGLTGDAGTVIDLLPAPTPSVLTLTVASGTDDFLGRFTGYGDLIKEGAGALRLAPVDTAGNPLANEIDNFTVNAGKLIATIPGLGDANSITVNANGTLEFESTTTWSNRNLGAPADIIFTADITGAGKLSKSGSGDILLSGTGSLPTGDISVLAGTLIVDDRRVGSVIPVVTVSAGATFELLLTGDRSLTNQITGLGGFSVSGAHQLSILNQPSYLGLTWLRSGADLGFDAALTAPVLHGLAADAANNVVWLNPGSTLTVIQNTAADFAGDFQMNGVGTANLVIQGTAAFRYTASAGNLAGFGGSVTVDGGILQVGLGNTKAITLSQGGTLQIYAALGADAAYTGSITIADSASELVKVGPGTLDLTLYPSGLPSVSGPGTFERLLVQEGLARVAINANGIVGVNKLAVSGTGALELSVASGTATILDAITAAIANGTGGSLTKTGTGTLVLGAGITTDAAIVVSAGTLQLGLSAASNCLIGGDLTVNAGARLTGSGTVNGDLNLSGTLAPGYSPGTLQVLGAATFGATSTYDVQVSGPVSDQTLVTGSLAIAAGATLKVTGWDNPATAAIEGGTPGDRHAILTVGGTAVIDPAQRFTNVKTETAVGDTTASQRVAYLVAYPGDTLGRANEIDVYVVRATQTGAPEAASLAPAGVNGVSSSLISYLSSLTRVEVDAAGNVVQCDRGVFNTALTPFGQRLAILSPTAAPGTIRSLTGMSYLAGLGMAHLDAAGDAEEVARRLEQRRYDRGYMSVKPREFYVTATSASWKAGTEAYAPNYDINRTGALAGYDRDLGTESVIGWAIALDRSKAGLDGGGSIDSTHARVMGYLSTVFADDQAYIEAGASVGYASMSAVRSEVSFGATSSPSAFTASAWTRLGAGFVSDTRTSFSPFVQLDVSYAKQSSVSERGDANTALDVAALSQAAVRGRAGFSLAQSWDSDRGDWRYRLSLDVAYIASLSGESVTAVAHNGGLLGANGPISATADPLDRGGLVLAPALNFGPDNDTTYSISTEFRRLGGGDATSVNFTYRRRF